MARRYLAREFATPEALREYLHEHPKADKSKHHVTKREDREGEHDSDEHDEGTAVSRLKGALKGLASKLKGAPAAVQRFVADREHRKEALGKGIEAVKKTPKTYVKKLVKVAKHEAKEFKTAGQGIAAAMKGGKPSAEQKKAIKKVSIHMGITATAAILTTASPALAGLAMGKAMSKHVALKAALEVLGDLHVMEELGHIGHGIKHVFEHLKFADEQDEGEGEKVAPEEALAALVLKHVRKQLENMDDEYLAEALGGGGSEKEAAHRVAVRYLSRRPSAAGRSPIL